MVDTVKRVIAKDPDNWKKQLLDFLYSYRYTPCSAAPEGKSPAELLFGRRMNSPFTKWLPKPNSTESTLADPTSEKQEAMEMQFSKHHGARPRDLAVGDRVIVLTRKNKREKGVISKVLSLEFAIPYASTTGKQSTDILIIFGKAVPLLQPHPRFRMTDICFCNHTHHRLHDKNLHLVQRQLSSRQ